MVELLLAIGLFVVVLTAVFRFAPRPRLNPAPPQSRVPQDLSLDQLASWLSHHEQSHADVIDGAEATIDWHDGPGVTDLCFLYIHGFSATRQEISPVTARVARHFGANAVYPRLAGHGLYESSMEANAEDWLQSLIDSWDIAQRIGRRVIVIGTSTGAPLGIWLNAHAAEKQKLLAFIFISPNFRIRNPFGFLLTWPWAKSWVPLIIGDEHRWEPKNEGEGKYWTNQYSTLAVIEMQKIVDWVNQHPLPQRGIPLATFYMEHDPTINHAAAIDFHARWPAGNKHLNKVDIDLETPQHVFAGDITAPQRTEWCVERCIDFIESLDTQP